MPIYEYTCQDCQADFEIIRSIKDADAPLNCEQCQGEHVKRRISLFNASSGGRVIAGGSSCGSCAGGACSSCGSH
jgi:putative FmdB family regulatory protein